MPDRISARTSVEMKATLLNAGVVIAREALMVPGASLRPAPIPALFALLEHPTRGIGLFDTGYSTRFFDATRALPFRAYRLATSVRVDRSQEARAQLADRGIDPLDVSFIVLTHFDPDHIGGLRDFPRARVYCSEAAWRFVEGKTGFAALRSRLLPLLLPDDLTERLVLLPPPAGPSFAPFDHTHDLFEDETLRIVSLPGHAPGHIGALLRVGSERLWLMAGDAAWCRAALRERDPRMHRVIAHDRIEQDSTYLLLDRFRQEHPGVPIIPSHCPEAADELLGGVSWREA